MGGIRLTVYGGTLNTSIRLGGRRSSNEDDDDDDDDDDDGVDDAKRL